MGKASRRNKEAKPKKARIKFNDRPFAGLAFEAELVAMREIIPAAVLPVKTTEEFGGEELQIVTLLPGMAAANRREDGKLLVAAQTVTNSGDVSLDIADRILKGLKLEPGESIVQAELPEADGKRLQDILDSDYESTMELHENFGFWISVDRADDPEIKQAIEASRDQVIPTSQVPGIDGAFWCRMQREFLRWVRREDEAKVLDGLARLQNKRELGFEGARFVGAFRALGLMIPVFELEAGTEADELTKPLQDYLETFEAAINSEEPLTADERRARSGIISRQVTLR